MNSLRTSLFRLVLTFSFTLGAVSCGDDDDDADVTVPADEVWLDVTIECPSCDSSGDLLFYASAGTKVGMPSFIVRYENPSFPIEKAVDTVYNVQDETQVVSISEGLYTFTAYQDLNGEGMVPDPGEPEAKPVTLELEKGRLNAVSLELGTDR